MNVENLVGQSSGDSKVREPLAHWFCSFDPTTAVALEPH